MSRLSAVLERLSHAARRLATLPGAVTVLSFLANELLMGLTPWRPVMWAAPYFPLRAVGIPLVGLFEALFLVGVAATTRSRTCTLRAVAGCLVIACTIWLNWNYDGVIFYDLLERKGANDP